MVTNIDKLTKLSEITEIRCLNVLDAVFNSKWDQCVDFGLDTNLIAENLGEIKNIKNSILNVRDPDIGELKTKLTNFNDFLYGAGFKSDLGIGMVCHSYSMQKMEKMAKQLFLQKKENDRPHSLP